MAEDRTRPLAATRAAAPLVHRRFVAAPVASAYARGWAATQLAALGLPVAVLDDVALVVGELVSNVVTHTDARSFDVSLSVGDAVTVIVEDDAASWPFVRAPRIDSESGRGMCLVEALTLGWGATITDRGKAVWVRIGCGA